MTDLLFRPDNDYQKEFDATVEKSKMTPETGDYEGYLVLDKTLFYPEGGGQPGDRGRISWNGEELEVVDVRKKHGELRHFVTGDELPESGEEVHGEIDWERRYKHMKMHTAQHILSKIVLEEFGATTAGNQIHENYSRIDFKPVEFSDEDVEKIEKTANSMIAKGLEVEKKNMSRDRLEAEMDEGRTNMELIPDHIDPLRVVEIGEEDVCPCGGTHVDSVEEIGEINITDRKTKGKDVERIEFKLE